MTDKILRFNSSCRSDVYNSDTNSQFVSDQSWGVCQVLFDGNLCLYRRWNLCQISPLNLMWSRSLTTGDFPTCASSSVFCVFKFSFNPRLTYSAAKLQNIIENRVLGGEFTSIFYSIATLYPARSVFIHSPATSALHFILSFFLFIIFYPE